MLAVTCPHCKTSLRVSVEAIGQVALCGACRRSFRLPASVAKPIAPVAMIPDKAIESLSGRSIYHYSTKVVGVTFTNPDGTSRQRIIAGCREGEELSLVPEPHNPVDPHAVAVKKQDGRQLGYIARGECQELSRQLRSGVQHRAFIQALIGRPALGESRGVVVLVVRPSAGTPPADVLEFVRQSLADRMSESKTGCGPMLFLVLLMSVLSLVWSD